MKIIALLAAGALMLSASVSVYAERLDVDNELINGSFDTNLIPWIYTPGDVAWVAPGAAQCDKTIAGWGDTMYQVVDDTTSNYWDPNGINKVIDLEADISLLTKDEVQAGVQFWIGYLDNTYDNLPKDQLPVVGHDASDPWVWLNPVSYVSTQSYSFTKVHPYESHLINGQVDLQESVILPIQPRWIVVQIDFLQPNNTINLVDNVWLTSRCIPEPGAMASIVAGMVGLIGFKRLRRK